MDRRLKNKLFCKYDRYVRPGDTNKHTEIRVRLNLKDYDYSDDKNTLTIESWMTISWTDINLSWNPSDFGGITSLNMKSDYLWNPQITLYNAHIASSLGTCHIVDCIIQSTSRVACVMPCSHTAHCKHTGVKNFPFDVQNCSFTFGSWMKTGEELNYSADKVTLVTSRAKKNHQWKLLDAKSNYYNGKYSGLNETFPSVTFSFVLERHNGYYRVTIFASAFALIVCNLIALWINAKSHLRFYLCAFNIYASFLCLNLMYWL
jgi:hypothetical protein